MNIIIDGNKANTRKNFLYRGTGLISANNSSRLLLDYKAENPAAYRRILELLFGKNGLAISHFKLEMGSDINSTSGTEPSVMRNENEEPDVTRGAGYQLAADAKAVNPELTTDMLWWSEPAWVSNSADVYAARYKWYKKTLDAAYRTYGLKFDYVSVTQNERAHDASWIKYFSKRLKEEKDCGYDYSKIKIVAGDAEHAWYIAEEIINDAELRNAVDVVGAHYISFATEAARKLADEYGKELWFSEASPPMSYSEGTCRYDGAKSGLCGINGVLDVANRFIAMYPCGGMTLCEYQPAVAAYYDGVTFGHKQLITANSPWNGYFHLESGFYMQLHFSRFFKRGWAFVDNACYCDAKEGGDGHALVGAVYSYMTAADLETGDYSTVIVNTSDKDIRYDLTVTNLAKARSKVYVWETRGPENDNENYDENYFKLRESIIPTDNGGAYGFSVIVRPSSMITVSTFDISRDVKRFDIPAASENHVLGLPYRDNYRYDEFGADHLSSRGYAPRYTTDIGGAFEVMENDNYLCQIITEKSKAKEWGWTPEPTTNFGDDRWSNYSVSASVMLDEHGGSDNYIGIGLRYNLASEGQSGYWIRVRADGQWSLMKRGTPLESGNIAVSDISDRFNLKITADENVIRAYYNETLLCEYVCENSPLIVSGRAAYFSAYYNNRFGDLLIEPVDNAVTHITRYDVTDRCFTSFEGNWEYDLMSSYKNYKRTLFTGSEGAKAVLKFNGTGFALIGNNPGECVISVVIDGAAAENAYKCPVTDYKEAPYYIRGLSRGSHIVEIGVVSGAFNIDSVEITG